MADTHPNAFVAEVAEKRKAAANLNAEADVLQAQWEELTGENWPVVETAESVDAEEEDEVETPEEPPEEDAPQTEPVKAEVKADKKGGVNGPTT